MRQHGLKRALEVRRVNFDRCNVRKGHPDKPGYTRCVAISLKPAKSLRRKCGIVFVQCALKDHGNHVLIRRHLCRAPGVPVRNELAQKERPDSTHGKAGFLAHLALAGLGQSFAVMNAATGQKVELAPGLNRPQQKYMPPVKQQGPRSHSNTAGHQFLSRAACEFSQRNSRGSSIVPWP